MPVDLVGALVGWLVSLVGNAGVRSVRSSDERALSKAIGLAIDKVVEQVGPSRDEILRLGLRECFSTPPRLGLNTANSVSEGLRAAISAQMVQLDQMEHRDTGQQFYQAVAVDRTWLVERISAAILAALPQMAAASSLAELVNVLNAEGLLTRLDALSAQISELTESAQVISPRTLAPVRPIAGWDPFHLGVHRPITVSQPAEASLPLLPEYVPRAHDRELDQLLKSPQDSTMIMLVGTSSTGKTRTAYEAIRRTLPDWPLLRPTDPVELLDILASALVATRSVLWLDETQQFFDGADGWDVATALRRLVAAKLGPVIVIGTMWLRHWNTYTVQGTDPDAPFTWPIDAPRDPDGQIHHLLRMAHKVLVPETFTDQQEPNPASHDPRWAVAVDTAGASRRVTQVLAGGPVLIERYEHPGTRDERYGQALLTAAMDARRLGYRSLLPRPLLEDALPAYLDTNDRAALRPAAR